MVGLGLGIMSSPRQPPVAGRIRAHARSLREVLGVDLEEERPGLRDDLRRVAHLGPEVQLAPVDRVDPGLDSERALEEGGPAEVDLEPSGDAGIEIVRPDLVEAARIARVLVRRIGLGRRSVEVERAASV